MNAKQILYKSDNLAKLRSTKIRSKFVGIKNEYVLYRTTSASTPRYYDVWIKLLNFPRHPEGGTEKDFLYALQGNIQIHSSCPDFLYHAYQYWSTRQNISINPELRRPTRNNVYGGVLVCKHLISALSQFIKDQQLILKDYMVIYH